MRDWRIGYVCSGTAYFTMLRANQRFRVQTDGGDTTRISPQGDAHFVLVATTADLIAGSGTTLGHRGSFIFDRDMSRFYRQSLSAARPGSDSTSHPAAGPSRPRRR
jgi:hypothetical protein